VWISYGQESCTEFEEWGQSGPLSQGARKRQFNRLSQNFPGRIGRRGVNYVHAER